MVALLAIAGIIGMLGFLLGYAPRRLPLPRPYRLHLLERKHDAPLDDPAHVGRKRVIRLIRRRLQAVI